MKAFDSTTLERFDRGEVDYLDAITAIFDSGALNLIPGAHGSFVWDDAALGALTFHGAASLLAIEVVPAQTGAEAQPIRVRFAETYLPAGAEVPVNVFDDDVRASIDEEEWAWRETLLHIFWRDADGNIIYREQVARRVIDAMPVEQDGDGLPVRIAVLERPEIVQRDIEGKTSNAEFQRLIDPTDKSHEHVGITATQKFILGSMPEQQVR